MDLKNDTAVFILQSLLHLHTWDWQHAMWDERITVEHHKLNWEKGRELNILPKRAQKVGLNFKQLIEDEELSRAWSFCSAEQANMDKPLIVQFNANHIINVKAKDVTSLTSMHYIG